MSGGLPFPDPVDPGKTVCIKVTIPDDVQYRGAFWGQMFYLTKWFAWEKDAAHTAKDVAALWQSCIMQSYENWIDGARCEDCTMEIRQNPQNPCQLQQSLNGIDWETVADFTDCKGETYSPYEPSELPLTNDERMDWAGLLGAAISTFAGYAQTTVSNTINYYSSFTPISKVYTVPQTYILAEMTTDWRNTAPAGERAELTSASSTFFRDFGEAIVCALDPYGNWTNAQREIVATAGELGSESTARFIEQFLQMSPTAVMESYRENHVGWTYNRNNMFPVPIECDWEHVIDFTITDGDFYLETYFPGDITQGEWVSGVGWRSTWGISITEVGDERVTIKLDFDLSRVTSFKITYDLDEPFHPSANGSIKSGVVDTPFIMSGGENEVIWTGDAMISSVQAIINGGLWVVDPEPPPYVASGRKCKIISATITGIGANPFD